MMASPEEVSTRSRQSAHGPIAHPPGPRKEDHPKEGGRYRGSHHDELPLKRYPQYRDNRHTDRLHTPPVLGQRTTQKRGEDTGEATRMASPEEVSLTVPLREDHTGET